MTDYYTSNSNEPARIKSIAEQFGFCLVKGVFSAAEMESLEREAGLLAKANNNTFLDLYSCPSLRWLMLDHRVQEIARTLLGERLVYYRETNIAFEETPGALTHKPFRKLHCDALGSVKGLEDAWDGQAGEIYGAYRFGLYFRNYRDFSGGLKVAPGSHMFPTGLINQYRSRSYSDQMPRVAHLIGDNIVLGKVPTPPFELFNVPSMPGDIVVFNLRTYHSAGAVRFASRPTLALLPYVESSLEGEAKKRCLPDPPGSRNAIFFDFGKPSEGVDFYIKWRALKASAEKYTAAEISNLSEGYFDIRNDKVIVSLAIAVGGVLEDLARRGQSLDTLSTPSREAAEKLLVLCRQHREFSPYHTLFDRKRFDDEVTGGHVKALQTVVQTIRQQQLTLA